MGKAKKVEVSLPSSSKVMSKSTSSSKISKECKLKELETFGKKKFIQDRGIDLNACVGSYVHKIIIDRNWDTWLNMIGVINETLVREFYHEFKVSTFIENALLNVRGVVFRVNSRNLNDFLGLPYDIESDFLDVDVVENLDLMGKTLCDDINFIWGKRSFIRQSELTKVSAFWHMFVCSNLVVSSNSTELNKEKIKIVFALVTNKPINLGEVLIEHIELAASSTREEKKLAFPGFISHLCLAKGVKQEANDVIIPPLEKLNEKRVTMMSYKGKGGVDDTFRIFEGSLNPSIVSSTSTIPIWAIHLRNEVEKSRMMIEASQRKIEELNAKVMQQDEKIKFLERNASTSKHYVRSTNRSIFLGEKSG